MAQLTRGQKAAATRARNKAAREAEHIAATKAEAMAEAKATGKTVKVEPPVKRKAWVVPVEPNAAQKVNILTIGAANVALNRDDNTHVAAIVDMTVALLDVSDWYRWLVAAALDAPLEQFLTRD